MDIFGTFNCNPKDDITQQKLKIKMNNQYITKELHTPNSGMCYCPNCMSKLTLPITDSFLSNFYHTNTTNEVTLELDSEGGSNFICISKVVLNLHYELPNITILAILPPAGPDTGATNVTVVGNDFPLLENIMFCYFGDNKVAAQVHSDKVLSCITQQTFPNIIYLSVGIEVEDTQYRSNKLQFRFYRETVLKEVRPQSSTLEGGTMIQIAGTFENTGIYICKFSSVYDEQYVNGALSDKTGAIYCTTPKWPRKENVQLSVSLNGQQYSKPLDFEYGDEKFVDASVSLICGVCAGVIAICIIVSVSVFWFRYHKKRAASSSKMTGNNQVDPGDIEYGECIGRGAFGEVFKGKWRGSLVAVKKLRITSTREDFIEGFEREIALMCMLRAPNILQFLGSAFDPPNVIIVMEYMPRGSLHDILHDRKISIEWPRVLDMMADTAKGMTYLHKCRPPVIHRDLKSHNLLVDEYWNVKVCDFGLSTVLRDSDGEDTSRDMNVSDGTAKFIGTPYWTAPEVLTNLNYTLKADVYSFGIVLWECITREDAYAGMQTYEVICAVAKEGLRPTIPQGIPHPYVYLMKRCWDESMDSRPHFQEILNELEEMKAYGWKGEPIKMSSSLVKSSGKFIASHTRKDNKEKAALLGKNNHMRKNMTSVCSYGSVNTCEPGSLITDSYVDGDISDY